MKKFWKRLSERKDLNALHLAWAVVGVVVTVVGILFAYSHNARTSGSQPESSTNVSIGEMSGGNVVGRDQYITNIEGISVERFQALAEELGVTKAALKRFFKILKEEQVLPEYLDKTLRQIAHQYKDLKAQLQHFTSEDPEVNTLKRQAKEALIAGEFDRAEELLNQAKEKDIQTAREFQNIAHKRLLSAATSAAQIAELKSAQLSYAEAADYYAEAVALVPQGEEKITAEYLNRFGVALLVAGKISDAERILTRSLDVGEKVPGLSQSGVAPYLNNLALVYETQDKHSEAELLIKRSLALWKNAYLYANPADVASGLNNLGSVYNSQGKYSEAESLYKRSLAIFEELLGPDHPRVAQTLNNLGVVYKVQGKYSEAESLYKRSLAITEQVLGRDHPDAAVYLINLGSVYNFQGKYSEAESLYKRSLAIREQVLGRDHPGVAGCLINLAVVYNSQGKYCEAEAVLKRSVAITEKTFGPDHPDVAFILNSLGMIYVGQGRYEEAEELLKRSLAIRKRVLGHEHPDVAFSMNNIAKLYRATNRGNEALVLEERAAHIKELSSGDTDR